MAYYGEIKLWHDKSNVHANHFDIWAMNCVYYYILSPWMWISYVCINICLLFKKYLCDCKWNPCTYLYIFCITHHLFMAVCSSQPSNAILYDTNCNQLQHLLLHAFIIIYGHWLILKHKCCRLISVNVSWCWGPLPVPWNRPLRTKGKLFVVG